MTRAIEAEQAVDPVEDKARELYEHVYVGRFEDGSSGVQAEYRKLAAYILGHEDRHPSRRGRRLRRLSAHEAKEAHAMSRLARTLVSLIGWLIDHHVQTANRHAVRRITKEKP